MLVSTILDAGPRLSQDLNAWQLSSYLFADITFVFDPITGRIAIFLGYEVNPELESLASILCPKYNEIKESMMRKLLLFHQATGIPFLTMNDSSLGLGTYGDFIRHTLP